MSSNHSGVEMGLRGTRLLLLGRSSLIRRSDGQYANANEGSYINSLCPYFESVTLCAPSCSEEILDQPSRKHRLRAENLKVVELPRTPNARIYRKLWNLLVTTVRVLRVAKGHHAVHFFYGDLRAVVGWVASRCIGSIAVIYVGGDRSMIGSTGPKNLRTLMIRTYNLVMAAVLSWIVRRSDVRLIRGDELFKRYAQLPRGRSYQMAMMSNILRGDAVPAITGSTELHNPPRILFVGRYHPETGLYDLLEALRLLIKESAQSLELWVAGDDSEAEQGNLLDEESGLSIRILGHVSNGPALIDVYRSCDIMAIPVRRSGLPRVLIEGMSQGLPVVATSVGGIPHLITDGVSGLLVRPNTVRELADALTRILEDDQLRTKISGNGLQVARSQLPERPASHFVRGVIAESLGFSD
ncbi:MAG: glycosyltransferase family 4 protein [SAR202 cluster bacterium]|nr:glycosyltransferase family 4 protein [SAR202 cluster bacterium]